jgi:TM2 domain-containing membrane protein YozV
MHAPGPAPIERRPRKSAFLAAILGLLCPGLGQFYVGRPGRGAWFLVVVLSTFAAGLWLTDGRGIVWDTSSVWFYAHVLAAGPTALASWLTRDLTLVARIPTWDAGLLYGAVAGLLNVVVLADALGVVDEVNAEADARDAEARERAEEEAALATAAAAAAATPALAAAGDAPAVSEPAGDSPAFAGAAPPPADAVPAAADVATLPQPGSLPEGTRPEGAA